MTDAKKVALATKILAEGLNYHEHDGHDMPKRVARDALAVLRGRREDWEMGQPTPKQLAAKYRTKGSS